MRARVIILFPLITSAFVTFNERGALHDSSTLLGGDSRSGLRLADARITHRGARGEGRRRERTEEKEEDRAARITHREASLARFASEMLISRVWIPRRRPTTRKRESAHRGSEVERCSIDSCHEAASVPPPLRVGEILSRVSLRVRYLFAFLLFGSDRAMSADSAARDLGTRRLLTSRNRRRVTLPPLERDLFRILNATAVRSSRGIYVARAYFESVSVKRRLMDDRTVKKLIPHWSRMSSKASEISEQSSCSVLSQSDAALIRR